MSIPETLWTKKKGRPSLLLILVVATVAGMAAGWLVYLIAGEPRSAEIAHSVWRWFVPGWGMAGRRAIAVCAGLLLALVILRRWARHFDLRLLRRRISSWPLLPTVVAAIVVGLVLVWVGYAWIENTLNPGSGEPPTRIDVLKTALTAVAGVGGAVALVVAYRRQRDLEQGRFIERFGAAAAQLGDPDPAVRIAGVYAMASAADEASEVRRQQCVDVLCGYLRLPYDPESGVSGVTEVITKKSPPGSGVLQSGLETSTHHRVRQNDRVVRQAITRVIADHLYRSTEISWKTCHFNFNGVTFEEADFRDTIFEGDALFHDSTFVGACVFKGAAFGMEAKAAFSGAKFAGQTLFNESNFKCEVDFRGAVFSDTVLFSGASFEDDVYFHDAKFRGYSSFRKAKFRGLTIFSSSLFELGGDFPGVQFRGITNFQHTNFLRATTFVGGYFGRGLTDFRGANFSGQTDFRWPREWSAEAVHFDWDEDPETMPDNILPQYWDWPPKVGTSDEE